MYIKELNSSITDFLAKDCGPNGLSDNTSVASGEYASNQNISLGPGVSSPGFERLLM